MQEVNFYFDFVSPYVWLAAHQLSEVRGSTGGKFRFVPVLFAGLLNHHANVGPAEIPAKRHYTFVDTQRWAAWLGLKFTSPPAHPFNPLKPLRLTSLVDDDDLREDLAVKLLDAAWSEGRDITSDSVLEELAVGIGLDGKDLLHKTHSDDVKRRLRRQTETAIAAGVFGVPSFVVDGEVYWGNDRLQFVKAHLQGKLRPDKASIEEILARPRAADRRRE